MFIKLFKNEFKRNKAVNLTLFFFIASSAMLIASAIYISVVLTGGVTQLLDDTDAPHLIQMHVGEFDESEIIDFNEDIDYIQAYQTIEMITINSSTLFMGDNETSEIQSVMDVSFVKQAESFDYLLDMNNEIAEVEPGEIGIPLYYKNKYDLDLNDTVRLNLDSNPTEFTIATFIRDGQMNSSLSSSKRLLVSDSDYDSLSTQIPEREYIVEYQFTSTDKIPAFTNLYTNSDLPQTGPRVDISLVKMVNAMTDGIVILVLILISIVLTGIGLLCLRYTLLGSLEEDIREIGVMKAIGLGKRKIKMMYMSKYIFLSAMAVTPGYVLSFFVNRVFVKNIHDYMGTIAPTFLSVILPLFGSLLILFIVFISLHIILRRCNKIAIVEAITNQDASGNNRSSRPLALHKKKKWPIPVFMGVNAVKQHLKSYVLMTFIFILAITIIVLPINVTNTFASSEFVNYMGVASSDLRLDVRQNEQTSLRIDDLMVELENDVLVENVALYTTCTMRTQNLEGETESLPVETGDYTSFSLDYLKGQAPEGSRDIALSYLAAESLGKEVGDTLVLNLEDSNVELNVVGIYQDITNGGKTAKMAHNYYTDNAIWHVINVNAKDDSDIVTLENHYGSTYDNIKITDVETYLQQTLGSTINQLRLVSILSTIIALLICGLITTLFLKMIIIKESKDIAIQQAIGCSKNQIMKQYIYRVFSVLLTAVISGLAVHLLVADQVISVISQMFGASQLKLVTNPFLTFIAAPALMGIFAGVAAKWVVAQFNIESISQSIGL